MGHLIEIVARAAAASIWCTAFRAFQRAPPEIVRQHRATCPRGLLLSRCSLASASPAPSPARYAARRRNLVFQRAIAAALLPLLWRILADFAQRRGTTRRY